jgi:hypothetical protein
MQSAVVTFNACARAERFGFGDQPQGDADPGGRPQKNRTINIPEELYQSAKQIAARRTFPWRSCSHQRLKSKFLNSSG